MLKIEKKITYLIERGKKLSRKNVHFIIGSLLLTRSPTIANSRSGKLMYRGNLRVLLTRVALHLRKSPLRSNTNEEWILFLVISAPLTFLLGLLSIQFRADVIKGR